MNDDVVLAAMKRRGGPLTRERYLALAYSFGLPEPFGAELEAEIPDELQLPEEEIEPRVWCLETRGRLKVRGWYSYTREEYTQKVSRSVAQLIIERNK